MSTETVECTEGQLPEQYGDGRGIRVRQWNREPKCTGEIDLSGNQGSENPRSVRHLVGGNRAGDVSLGQGTDFVAGHAERHGVVGEACIEGHEDIEGNRVTQPDR